MKNTNVSKPLTAEQIEAERQSIVSRLRTLEEEQKKIEQEKEQKIAFEAESFPKRLEAIIGRPVTPLEAIRLLQKGVKALFSPTEGQKTEGTRTRNVLTKEQNEKLHQVLMERQARVDAGLPVEKSISQIAADFGISDVTVNNRKREWKLTRRERTVPNVVGLPASAKSA